ncbi:MAG TPA: ABC transporter permease [Bryobacteraceae bacterium]|nr:hypothetical protein [Bryobacterales bacterium]HRJ19267.1 ABC transporter permease [Bryobacteraceae bacterium]
MKSLSDLISGFALAFRTLLRQPAFLIAALLILGLGVGANTAIFSVVRQVLLEPLPYQDASQLYVVWTRNLERSQPRAHFSAPEFLDFQQQTRSFSQLSASRNYAATWTGAGSAQRVATTLVTTNYLDMLGLRPVLGRGFVEQEGRFGNHNVAILTHDFWHARMGADPAILGRTIVLDDEPHEIIGVLPAIQGEMRAPELYLPAAFSPQELASRASRYLSVLGRLAPGVTTGQASQELQAIAARIAQSHPEARGWDAWLVPAQDEFTREARQPLLVLFAAVGLVLLIACANLASLLLVRAAARQREFAVRAALGAGKGLLIRQMMIEAFTLSALGGALGVLVAFAALRLLVRSTVLTLPRLDQTSLDGWALIFNFGAALAAGLLFGLFPALRAMRVDLAGVLRDEARGSSGGLRQSLGRSLLVVSEVALSVVLLVAAGLLVRTFDKLSRVQPGFQSGEVLTLRTTLPYARYQSADSRANYGRRAAERLSATPGVQSAGLTTALPLMGVNWMASFTIDGVSKAAQPQTATYNAISPGYFPAIGARLLSGRDFLPSDSEAAAPVVIISDELQRTYFDGRNATGRMLRFKVANQEFEARIVGVVNDIRHLSLDEPPRVALYQPHAQLAWPFLAFAIRTHGDPMTAAAAVRQAFHEVDPSLPVERVQPLGALVDRALAQQRLAMALLWIFSIMATILAAIGLYGVMAVAVAQRRREFGIRLALGASRRDLLRHVLGQGLLLTLAGLTAGLSVAPAAAKGLEKMLYGVERVDAATYLAVGLLLIFVTIAACLPPAWRASRTDPSIALRAD